MSEHPVAENSLYSTMGDDPDVADLVETFVDEVPNRVARIVDCLQRQDWDALGFAAHQFNGAAGSYGFTQVTPALARLESLAKGGADGAQTRQAVEEVVELCGRMRAGTPMTA